MGHKMWHLCVFPWFLVLFTRPLNGFFQTGSCDLNDVTFLNPQECEDLYFEPSEPNGVLDLSFHGSTLNISAKKPGPPWQSISLRLGTSEGAQQICAKLKNEHNLKSWFFDCWSLNSSEIHNETEYLLEVKLTMPSSESVAKKIMFVSPKSGKFEIWSYVDFSDTGNLVVYGKKMTNHRLVDYVKVEAFKDKQGKIALQDLRLFPASSDFTYAFLTYNDEGVYFFNLSVISDTCPEDVCPKTTSAKIHIGRKSTKLVIGIVGASFMLPFVLFIFHLLTRKFNRNATNTNSSSKNSQISDDLADKIVLVYKMTKHRKHHDDAIAALAAILQKYTEIPVLLDPLDPDLKTPVFCSDALLLATHIVYVAETDKQSPLGVSLGLDLSDKQVCSVVFSHCSPKLPPFFQKFKTYQLPRDFDEFMAVFQVACESLRSDPIFSEFAHILKKAESDNLPKIVVTECEPEPRESDGLLPNT